MKKKFPLILILGLFAGTSLFALDKERLAENLLQALNQSPSTQISVGDPYPSEIAGLIAVPVLIQGQEQVVYMTPDEKQYIFGNVFDLTVNYDDERMNQMNLKDAFSQGSKKAPVTIVEFSDLECGYCRKAHLAFEKDLFMLYPKDKVRWVYKHFPLQMHAWAEDGAVAGQCAGEQGNDAFWGMMSLLYENAREINKENLSAKVEEYARQLKLNQKKLAACMGGDEARKKVLADRDEGIRLGVRSTPTFFINGRMQRGFRDIDSFKPLIDAKLAAAEKK